MADAPASSSTTTTIAIGCNVNFLTSPVGILKIVEVVLGLIAWACAAHIPRYNGSAEIGFTLFAFISCWLITLITLGIYLTGTHASACSGFPWTIFETIFNSIATLLYFIGSCIIASVASKFSGVYYFSSIPATYGASAAFGFFTTIAYIIHAVFYFQKWRGVYPWQGCGSGNGSGSVST